MTRTRQLLGLVGWLLACYAVAGIGARASIAAASFYGSLALPSWAPPAQVFGPVWTLLYGMMAVAGWLVWREGGWARQRRPLLLFLAQLVVNALWSWLFFAWRQGGMAFVDIALLWVLILATLVIFWRVRVAAGVLLLPYLCWVGFALALNYVAWRGNPHLLGY